MGKGKDVVRVEIDKYKLNNEQYLAALLSVKQMTDWQKEQALQLATEIDIESFQHEVIEHRVCGLVMDSIQKNHLLQEERCGEIKKKANCQIFEAMKLSAELVKITQKFFERGIPFLLLKGPVLGERLYGDVAKRTSRDLDILVSLQDIDRAANALKELGYQTKYFNQYTPKQMKHIYQQGHHFDFWNSEGTEIELHWRVSETLNITLEYLWENRKEVIFAGSPILIPGEIEELSCLIHHGIGHGFHRMKWLIDIVELLKQGYLDWNKIIEYASKMRILNELFSGILLCYAIDAFDMPNILTEKFRIYKNENKIVVELYQKYNKQLIKAWKSAKKLVNTMEPVVCYKNGNRDFVIDSREYIDYYHIYIKERDRFQGIKRIQRLWARLQPGERDFAVIQLKDQYFILYYILRPIYWIYLVIKR